MLKDDLPPNVERKDCGYLATFAEPDVYTQGGCDVFLVEGTDERYDPEIHGDLAIDKIKRVETMTVWLRIGSGAQVRIGSGPKEEAASEAQETLSRLSEQVLTSINAWVNRPRFNRRYY